ncbi:ABC transporter substrate-binding protein [Anaerosalibacter bizertensis]|uniref:ABC transporter substrate-binding protein n=1 Tax=Anaerosalibacter bizertensis TaxID=932217 RepID=A0A844FIN9_9FIRM|nr:ABC transporter substrate-binding protein [Anaerosalibacter bizertensis]MBU5294198.1 ABC transporter substrate-binding protein [Anaerosalibacter bizertensis]MBV1819023.1 ABC transporter substrate-binding protein [Bacteroidales bacterium MSK.15.36]MCG4582992.1 ABC transporter substrate-binding protein [Anaerosalibacter bizertensis]MSS43755.1 ABC transporter substrate-binding protein [Anaerosalibacter bizertensis]
MNKKLKLFSLVLVLTILISFSLTGCKKNNLKTVKLIEVTHSLFYTPQYVAITQGFFEDEGLDIELINGKGADKCMTALLSGEADIGFMGPEASVYVYNQGKTNYAINFAQLTQKDGSFLVGREKEEDFDFKNLKGKTIIGGRKGGMPEMTLEYVLKKHGLEPGVDVNVRTDIQFDVMAGAFTGGEGDYVALFEPVAATLEKEGKGYVVASIGKEAGYIPYTCYSATKDYIEKNEDTIQKFTNAIYKGMLWVQSHSVEEIAEAVKPQFPDTDDEVLIALITRYKEQDTWKPDLLLTEDGLNHMMDIMEMAGELEERADYNKIVTDKFAKKAMKEITK